MCNKRKDLNENDLDYYNEGVSFYYGWGKTKNQKLAKELYEKGAKLGCAKCKYALIVVENSSEERKKVLYGNIFDELLVKAKNDDAESQRMVSCYYLNGDRGVEKDLNQAFKWLRLAAENGNAIAMYNLARCYFTGEGVDKDQNIGAEWLRKSANLGFEKAIYMIEKIEG